MKEKLHRETSEYKTPETRRANRSNPLQKVRQKTLAQQTHRGHGNITPRISSIHPSVTVLRDHTFPATGNAPSLRSEAHTDPPAEEEGQEDERNTERRRRQRMEALVGPAGLSSSSNGSCSDAAENTFRHSQGGRGCTPRHPITPSFCMMSFTH
ncbi:hypothetical protein CRENBAI_012997 [Crenichthys baileyi]|uniref:Uncharacterized protein n=1 Tax=Crenichthys baileyi TaxID=28760 RepID=A0AAV9SL01_9TELE